MNVTKEQLRSILKEAGKEVGEMAEYYQLPDGVPDRITEKLELVLGAKDLEEAKLLAIKAVRSMQITALGMWGNGKAMGPRTPENLDKIAKKKESYAEFAASKGNEEAADRSRKAAESLRQQAEAIRKGEELPANKKTRRKKT